MITRLVGAAAMAAWIGVSAMVPASAAPPTAVPSPGYERRLIESRRALGSSDSRYDESRIVVPHQRRGYDRRYRHWYRR
jgi:hypothetical protein